MGSYAAKVAAGLIPAAAVAGLGLPALGALVLVVVLILAFACWVIGNQNRTNRVSEILRARRSVPAPEPATPASAPSVPPSVTGVLKKMLRLGTAREKQRG